MTLLSSDGYPYRFDPDACRTCPGRCCNGETGNIWVNAREIEAIAGYLGVGTDTFIARYLRKVGYRLSIRELKFSGNYACVFFDEKKNGCGIYPVRPEQCRTFPFWPYFRDHLEEVCAECPGVILSPGGRDNR
ncbi:YkgJ family cysteine cluster protein [Desulfatiferula olefinivorans]